MKNPLTTTDQSPGNSPKASKSRSSGADSIDALLSRNPILWRGCDMAGRGDYGQPTGYPQLDAVLPGRGWPRNTIVEIISRQWGLGELQLLVPLMREVTRQGQWILWVSPPYVLNSPALLQAGIHPEQILVINLDTSCKDALWTMEKALQTGSCGLVLAWQNWLPDKVVRRLQLAAETGETLGVLFQHRMSKHLHSSLRIEIKNFFENSPIGKVSDRNFYGAARGSVYGDSMKHSERSTQTQITVLKARGNFRPLSVQLNLYQDNLPFRPAIRPEGNREQP